MNKRTKVATLLMLSWCGAIMLSTAGILSLPSFFQSKKKLTSLTGKLSNRQVLQKKIQTFLSDFLASTDKIKSRIKNRTAEVNKASFECPANTQISSFIEELQTIFKAQGISLINLAYKKQEIIGNFIELPFEAELQCSYDGMRKLIHKLETHKSGIRILKTEFLTLDDEVHAVKVKMLCSLRFKTNG
eukprot:Anaeramoba_ignava/a1485_5.p1 GENE.a1485_5~~a1485_5.p1  ORF type:complete len:188 (+),score=1.89 a1485_5:43-606(+)